MIAWRGDGARERAFRFVRTFWKETFPSAELVVSDSGPGAFTSYRAMNRGVAAATCDVIVQADADNVPRADLVREAVALAAAAPGLVYPGSRSLYLDIDPTNLVLAGAVALAFDPPCELIATGNCGGVLAYNRATWEAVGGYDERFDGWGFGEVVYSPLGSGPPSLAVQEEWDAAGDVPLFHLLVTGEGCLTEFLTEPVDLPVPEDSRLYADVSRQIEAGDYAKAFAPSCAVVEWDWWNLHQGVYATKREFRFLIRVTESDYHAPQPRANLDQIIRAQQMVYSPTEFGW